ncbi:hypothetical protein [Nocardia sp. CDC160]|uniref:hypothetical protein n=1 Tax=Nocardia sp. CDC160 TaxID=3112166 RepID=UPI002DBC388A|nr:hypothetical protein [Nocardia sp. CDC160]MEC3919310.1 hypothetical protein [Nocardia sp. CDC160]
MEDQADAGRSNAASGSGKKAWCLFPLLGIVAIVVLLRQCGSHENSKSSDRPPASTATARFSPDEQAALDALHGACREDDAKLDAEAKKANELLQQAGIHDENTVTVLQHLRGSLPDSAPVMNCAEILGAYITLREKGIG